MTKEGVSNLNIAAFTAFSSQPAPHSSPPPLIRANQRPLVVSQTLSWLRITRTHMHGFPQNPLSTTTLRARIYDRRVNRESGKETCRCPSGLSSWFLVKETSIFCPGFYLRLKERMTSIKNRGHPRGYCRRDRTQLLSNFSSCNFLLKPSICSSLDGYRRGGKTFFSAWGSIIYPPPPSCNFHLSPKHFISSISLQK